MSDNQHPMIPYWEKARKQGIWKYTITSGWMVGVAMGLVFWLLDLADHSLAEMLTLAALLKFLLNAVIMTLIFGLSTWSMNEWMWKRRHKMDKTV